MDATTSIRLNEDALTMNLPMNYTGPVTLPGNGKTVYWTGRVAIGLRHQATQFGNGMGQSAIWIQKVLLGERLAA